MYPRKSLNILLVSNRGSGTTYFASLMFQFAKESGVLTQNAPYVKINCRHYSKNITVLNEELFGSNNEKNCCFARAQGGMLFIDNADLLDAKQQSMLFEFIETGKVYSEDRSELCDYKDVFLVVACTPQSTLQTNRKLPVMIELPELKERSGRERFGLINRFFFVEAANSNRCIEVTMETMKALLLFDFVHGIKEMELAIKAACANAYVRVVNETESDIVVCVNDFESSIRKSLLKLKESGAEIEAILGVGDSIFFDSNTGYRKQERMPRQDDVYEEIKKQYDELSKRGIDSGSIEKVVNTHINNLFKKYRYHYDNSHDMEQLTKIVDAKVINLVGRLLEACKKELNKNFKSNVFYGLCLHINSLLTLNFESQRVNDDQIVKIIQEYPKEYAASVQFGEVLKMELNLDLPLEEIVLITMFLIDTDETSDEDHPVLLYIMHGKGTASSLRDVTNSLTHCHNAYSYDLALNIDCGQAMEEIKNLLLKIDNGQGVIVIYDMGSIRTMLDTISEEIEVKIRYMNIPITLIGIDIARKCFMETDIDYVYHMANLEINKMNRNEEKHNDIIITLCHTGEGGALQLKRYIDQYSKLGIKTIALSISARDELLKEVMSLRKTYRIHCFVGTYDPKLFGIPFVSIGKIFENSNEDLDRILMFEPVHSHSFDYSEVYQYLEEQFTYVSIAKLKTVLPEVIDSFSMLYSMSDDQRAGLFMHLACLIERLLEGKSIVKNSEKNKIISAFEEDYHAICKILGVLEKAFKVIIDDNEIATIIMIVKKI